RLGKQLTIKLPRSPHEIEASIELEGEHPQTIANWANAYAALAMRPASGELLSGLTSEVKIRQKSLDDQIDILRQVGAKIRNDQITRLESALAIAEAINLESPADGATLVAINPRGLNTEDINSGSLLYLRGAKA